jgi:hypothetical protein
LEDPAALGLGGCGTPRRGYLLTHRKLLQSKAIAIENDLRGTLRNFGLKVGMVGKGKFEARIRELVDSSFCPTSADGLHVNCIS